MNAREVREMCRRGKHVKRKVFLKRTVGALSMGLLAIRAFLAVSAFFTETCRTYVVKNKV